VPSAPPFPGVLASVRGGWSLLAEDPFGILLPTAAMLFVDAALASAARGWARSAEELLAAAAALFLVRPFVQVPFVARVVSRAAALAGCAPWPSGRPVALLGAELVVAPLVAAAFLAPVAGGVALAGAVAHEGWLATAAAIGAGAAAIGATLALAVRAVFARVPWEVAVAGRSAVGALAAAVREAPSHAIASFALLFASDLAIGMSALACGALVLPGYPLAWLALAWRWGRRAEAP
jgi:hypothetical protein